MGDEIQELVDSIESCPAKEDLSKRIILVGTHQGASLHMAQLWKNIKHEITEVMGKLAVKPQRGYPQKAKKGRSRS